MFKWIALFVIAAQSAAIVHVSAEKVVRAEKFELVDSAGKVRGFLGCDETGPVFEMVDAKGRSLISLGADMNTSGKSGRFRVAGAGPAAFTVSDEEGAIHASLSGHIGQGHINLSIADDGAHLSLLDEKLRARAILAFTPDATGLVVADAEGKGGGTFVLQKGHALAEVNAR